MYELQGLSRFTSDVGQVIPTRDKRELERNAFISSLSHILLLNEHMECLQNRIDSFSKPVRVQNASKTGAAKNIKWPHPNSFLAKPELLAEAGFYFDPSYDERDNVTCFVCGKELAGWEEEDDPFEIHWKKCAKTCAWAVIRCGLREDLDANGRYASQIYERKGSQIYYEIDLLFRTRTGYLQQKSWREEDNKYLL